MTLYFANHQITIYRNRRRGSTNIYSMSATYTAFQADIQPTNPERQPLQEGRFGAVFVAYVDLADLNGATIKENDEIVTTDDGKRYSVLGVSKWAGAGLLDHLELNLVSKSA